MQLETPRLLVRDLVSADLDAVHAVFDPDRPVDASVRTERSRWLEWTILGYDQRRRLHQPPYGEYGVVLRSTGDLVGVVGLVTSMMPFGLLPNYAGSAAGHSDPYNVAEVGLFWEVAAAHRRNGYAAEAGAALVRFAFTEWHLRRIVATTEHDNAASIGVMRRLGMRIERNPFPAPFFLQVVGILDNPGGEPRWHTADGIDRLP